MRSNGAPHKRLVLLATIALLTAAIGRWPFAIITRAHFITNLILVLIVLLVAVFDFWSLRRIHRATICGGIFLILMVNLAVPIGATSAWQRFAGLALRFWQGWRWPQSSGAWQHACECRLSVRFRPMLNHARPPPAVKTGPLGTNSAGSLEPLKFLGRRRRPCLLSRSTPSEVLIRSERIRSSVASEPRMIVHCSSSRALLPQFIQRNARTRIRRDFLKPYTL